jgi:hypothetical protein
MSKFSLSVYLNAYDDTRSTNAPSRSPINWSRDLQSILVSNPKSEDYTIAPGETRLLFSGVRTLLQDVTTEYSLSLVAFSTQTYQLSWASGTLPNFRTPRTTGADATTQVTTSINGPLVTFTSTGGTNFSFGSVIVGDYVTIGNLFNSANQGTFQIVAVTATSFTIANLLGVIEGPITLGAGFATQVQIYSAAGVQVGDTLVISSGFSPVTWGSYKITAVYAESLQFYSTAVLPQESSITTEVAIYSNARSFIYLETDSTITISINGNATPTTVQPFPSVGCCNPGVGNGTTSGQSGNGNVPGMLMLKSTIYSLSVTNNGIDPANVFLAAVE